MTSDFLAKVSAGLHSPAAFLPPYTFRVNRVFRVSAGLPLCSVCCVRTGLALVRMCVCVCSLSCACASLSRDDVQMRWRGRGHTSDGARASVGVRLRARTCAYVCACVHVDASDGQRERQEPVIDLLIPFPCKPLIPAGAQASSAGRRAGSGFKIREPHGLWGLRRRQPAAGAEVKFGEPSVVDWNSQADRTDPSAQFLPKPPRQAG